MNKREGNEISVPRLIGALLIAIGVLAFAFMKGYLVSYLNLQRVNSIEDTIKFDLLSTQLSGDLLQSCNDEAFGIFSKKLDKTGALISLLEDRFGSDDENVLAQKKQYFLLEVQHYLAVKEYSEVCGKNLDIILFFYSNEKDQTEQGQFVGEILTKVKLKDREGTMVYSFDQNVGMDIIDLLLELNSVDGPNAVVVNSKPAIYNVENIDDVLVLL